ncbi:hypothetical protein chiPu_0019429 [Chiloscyllium punctatum]|uniref:Uncharacterized protein n=1 Tax=Chiloscyllium punctatum TaxID=137246 RepID=A0A401RRU3_CHIPU|nr:hypothetical protein [Chiloscyllium punctatum]
MRKYCSLTRTNLLPLWPRPLGEGGRGIRDLTGPSCARTPPFRRLPRRHKWVGEGRLGFTPFISRISEGGRQAGGHWIVEAQTTRSGRDRLGRAIKFYIYIDI